MGKMPVLFIGHGSPMNMIADNEYTRSLGRIAEKLPRPRAALVVSAHWQTRGTWLTTSDEAKMIYDFGGFPEELYRLQYPCQGAFQKLRNGVQWLQETGIEANPVRGNDHAAYAVLMHMYPMADIPVMELSLDLRMNAAAHYDFAKRLSVLREEGVLIVGSGNLVHNLGRADFYNLAAPPYEWNEVFDMAAAEALLSGHHNELIEYEKFLPQAGLAVPTDEHYLPFLYAAALIEETDELDFFHVGYQNAAISMRCLRIG